LKHLILAIFIFYFAIGFSQEKIEPPAISINSLFLNQEIKNGIPNFWYDYNSKKLKNFKYRILVNQETKTQNIIKNKGQSEGDDIKELDSEYSYGKSTGLILEGTFKNGYKDGLWKTTYENRLVKTENYNNGLTIGRYKVFNTKGDILYQTTFGSQGNGKYQDYYYNSGILKEEGFYKNGKKDGEWCSFDENGKLVESIIYNNGVIQE